jgi:hypothetical protein
MPPRDLNLQAKLPSKSARVSVWHLARYGFRAGQQALDLTSGYFEASGWGEFAGVGRNPATISCRGVGHSDSVSGELPLDPAAP